LGGFVRKILAVVLLALGLESVAFATTKHMPLPPSLMLGKRVYIENQTPDCPQCADQVYGELTKWGRFQIVTDPKESDLVFVLTSTSSERPVGVNSNTSGSNTYGTVVSVEDYTVYLTVVDGHTGQRLYSIGEYWRFRWSKPSVTLIKKLRERIAEEEPGAKH
jgi:hypothetical protein